MYLYNLTTNVAEEIEDKWLDWMRKTHIPNMMATNKFTNALLIEVSKTEEMGGITYVSQYKCESAEKLKAFYIEDSGRLNSEVKRIFGEKVLTFGMELKVVEEFDYRD